MSAMTDPIAAVLEALRQCLDSLETIRRAKRAHGMPITDHHSATIDRARSALAAYAAAGSDLAPTMMHKAGKRRAGRLLDGVEHNAMPERARIP